MPVIASSLDPIVATTVAVGDADKRADSDAASDAADELSPVTASSPPRPAASWNAVGGKLRVVSHRVCGRQHVTNHLFPDAVSNCLIWLSATASCSRRRSASSAAAAAAAADASPARRNTATLSSSALFLAMSVASSCLFARKRIRTETHSDQGVEVLPDGSGGGQVGLQRGQKIIAHTITIDCKQESFERNEFINEYKI
jgi:hypothetical protein